jgi:hypothetical protein
VLVADSHYPGAPNPHFNPLASQLPILIRIFETVVESKTSAISCRFFLRPTIRHYTRTLVPISSDTMLLERKCDPQRGRGGGLKCVVTRRRTRNERLRFNAVLSYEGICRAASGLLSARNLLCMLLTAATLVAQLTAQNGSRTLFCAKTALDI